MWVFMEQESRYPFSSGGSRPALSRVAAWREVALAVAVLWLVLGGGCFWAGAQWVHDCWGTSLNAALILDVIFFAGCLAISGFVGWRQRLGGEGFRELGWGRPAPWPALVIAIVFGLAWVALSYARGGDPLAWPWPRPIMMGIGLVLAFGEEIMVRGLILDRLHRCGTSRLVQVVVTGAIMGVYHGIIGHHVWPSYMVSSFVLFSILSMLYVFGGRSLTPALIAHAMTHFLGDPSLMQGILRGVQLAG